MTLATVDDMVPDQSHHIVYSIGNSLEITHDSNNCMATIFSETHTERL